MQEATAKTIYTVKTLYPNFIEDKERVKLISEYYKYAVACDIDDYKIKDLYRMGTSVLRNLICDLREVCELSGIEVE